MQAIELCQPLAYGSSNKPHQIPLAHVQWALRTLLVTFNMEKYC